MSNRLAHRPRPDRWQRIEDAASPPRNTLLWLLIAGATALIWGVLLGLGWLIFQEATR